jgi:hypothetical protein
MENIGFRFRELPEGTSVLKFHEGKTGTKD